MKTAFILSLCLLLSSPVFAFSRRPPVDENHPSVVSCVKDPAWMPCDECGHPSVPNYEREALPGGIWKPVRTCNENDTADNLRAGDCYDPKYPTYSKNCTDKCLENKLENCIKAVKKQEEFWNSFKAGG